MVRQKRIERRRARLDEPISRDIVPRFARAAMLFGELSKYLREEADADALGFSRAPTVKSAIENALDVVGDKLANITEQSSMSSAISPGREVDMRSQLVEDAAYVGRLISRYRKEVG